VNLKYILIINNYQVHRIGMDSVSNDIKLLRLEELKYMKENPHLYEYKRK
jgi:hypothetical protein